MRHTPRYPGTSCHGVVLGSAATVMLVLLLTLAACEAPPTATSTPTPIAPTATPNAFPVAVYFSRHPDSDNDPTAVFPVTRLSATQNDASVAIAQLITGPTTSEKAQGYYTPFNMSGTSTCGSADFTLSLDRRGTALETGTATLQFCRVTGVGGELDDARVTAEVTQTLLQFSNIKQVVILTLYGDCFGDLSGQNACLK